MLSPAQQLAVTASGHAVVAACPGSGKSTVLKFRAEHLLQTYPDIRLAAVTFTRDAADSLKLKIVKQVPGSGKRVQAGTFHNLCGWQLTAAGLSKGDVQQWQQLVELRNAYNACPFKSGMTDYDDCVDQVFAWQREVSPCVPADESSVAGFMYRAYTQFKIKNNLRDFDDLIRDAVIGMRSGQVKPLSVDYMLVDEFQDTDELQLAWVMEHVAAGTKVTIVGDDDQSIYGFRGSLGYQGMMTFLESTKATLINLDRTYRCSREVLQPAAVLISMNQARVPKSLITNCKDKGQVRVVPCSDREQEAEAIVQAIVDSESHDWAVLARTNMQLDVIEEKIQGRFPYYRKKKEAFWQLQAPSLLLGMVDSIVQNNMKGMSQFLKRAGVKPDLLSSLAREHRFEHKGSLDQFCRARLPSSGRSKGLLGMMQTQVSEWKEMFDSGSTAQINLALGGIGGTLHRYGEWSASESADAFKRIHAAARSIASMNGPLDRRLRILQSPPTEAPGDGVSLMTFHRSKGLEFDRVWIMGMDEGTFPSTKDDSNLEEERRLAYVGMTRAKRFLTMSHCTDSRPSQFLKECGLVGSDMLAAPAMPAAYAHG